MHDWRPVSIAAKRAPSPRPPPVAGSRRPYVDSGTGNNSDLTVERSDGTVVDLEGGMLNYQKPKATMGSGTVYTFSVPSIPAGKSIRARVYWRCAVCTAQAKTFTWQFGPASTSYGGYTGISASLAYSEVRIFNDPGVQNLNTMLQDPIIWGNTIPLSGSVSSPNQNTSGPESLTFSYAATSDTITPKGFIVEAIQ